MYWAMYFFTKEVHEWANRAGEPGQYGVLANRGLGERLQRRNFDGQNAKLALLLPLHKFPYISAAASSGVESVDANLQ